MAALCGLVSSAHGQRASIYDLVPDDTWKLIKVGPFFSAGECFNSGPVSDGISAYPALSYSAGVNADFPLRPRLAFDLAIAYDARQINFQEIGNSDNGANYNFSYLTIRPEVRLSWFLVGVGIGLPIASSASGYGTFASSANLGTSTVNMLFEFRIGVLIPLAQWTTGVVNLSIEGAYALSQITSAQLTPYGATTTAATPTNNGPLMSGEIGIQYLFALTSR